MGHYHEPTPLNGADAYGSSLMNPFAFTDEELLLHVTPQSLYTQRDGYNQSHASILRSRSVQIPGMINGNDSGGLSALASLLDAGEATSLARPHPFTVSEAQSRSTCSPGSPPRLASGPYTTALPQSQVMSESHACALEPAESRDCLEDPADHREKNRVAQKKFRARQKEKMRTTQKQLDDLTRQVSTLLSEKSQLETRTRILEQVVYLNTNHEQMLHANQEIMAREQELLLEEFTRFVGLLDNRTDLTVQDAKAWNMDELMENIHPKYVEQISKLAGLCQQDSTAAAELETLVSMRRDHEERRALFSCYYWAIYSWNREEMTHGGPPPSLSTWKAALHGLRLTGQQSAKVLTARRCLLDKLHKVGLERRQLLSALGLQLLQTPQEKWAQSVPVQRLQNNLGQERAAASAFLFSTIDEILTSQQEAFLDSHSYPWCPDMWQMAQLLAVGKAEPDVKDSTQDLDMSALALKSLLPDKTGFQLLTQPLRARGLGLRLKRGVLKNPYQTVLPAAAFPYPSIDQLRPMTVFDVHCGRYRDITFWDWVKTNMPNVLSIIPH